MNVFTDTRQADYADIEALPDNMVGQIIYGTLHSHPRFNPRHAYSATGITS